MRGKILKSIIEEIIVWVKYGEPPKNKYKIKVSHQLLIVLINQKINPFWRILWFNVYIQQLLSHPFFSPP